MKTQIDDFAAGLADRHHHLADGQRLFAAGQKPTRMFVVAQGCMRLTRPLRTGSNAVMQTARKGEWLAESSLFSSSYHCDAIARGTTELVSVSKRDLLTQFACEPWRYESFCKLLADHLRKLRGLHEIVRLKSARERVMEWLLLQAAGRPANLRLDQTWSDIAEELALTREAVYRAVASLTKSGALERRGEAWIVRPRLI
ncbi:MAG: Crp/Fnr family transcriptional regulator [Povalibacter sp.]